MKTQELEVIEDAKVLEYPGLSGIAAEETAQQDAIDDAQAQAEAEAVEVEQEDNFKGWLAAIEHATDMIVAVIPEATPVWSPKRQEALAKALARCDEAYGWGGVGGFFSHPLIGLAFAAGPLVLGTAKAIKQAQENKTVDVDAREVKPNADPMGAAAAGPAAPAGA